MPELEQIIVLVDGAGNYYEVPRAFLERRRVPDERKAKVRADLQKRPEGFHHIARRLIPGSSASLEFIGGYQLRYAGFYLSRRRRTDKRSR